MNDEMDEIISEFITEAEESLDRIEPLFVELEKKGQDIDLLNDIFRSMHTIKGAAGFLGLQRLVDVAHTSENIMKKLRDSEISLSKELMDCILKAIDMLRLLLGHLKEKDGIEEDVSPLVHELESALNKASAIFNGTEETILPEKKDSPDSLEVKPEDPEAEESAHSEQEKKEVLQTAETEQSGLELPEDVKIKEMNNESRTETGPAIEQKKENIQQTRNPSLQKGKEAAQNLRVDVDRIDKVMDLAGEVVLVRNRLLNISRYFDQQYSEDPQTETLTETVSFLDRVTSDMQLAVMKIRMQPIKKVLSKFPRLVRDISSSLNKDVELVIFGENTEVDKSVIEHIGDPMTHILRNSLDHGLESREERIAKGKPPKGKVTINTFQQGNQIIIEISDDGKGMDIEMLKKIAIMKGLLTEEDADKMSSEAAAEIIFMPGFSTKKEATDISGRGVGMDVVKTNISLLNGFVEISTKKEEGTSFRMCIPLTLAIMQALMVEVKGVKYAIPLSPIEETLRLSNEEIDNVTGQSVVVIRGKVCPLYELSSILGNGPDESSDMNPDHKYLVVVALGEKRFCVAVDRLLGQEEVVIKTLDGVDTSLSHVLGATITGEGKVVFILDVTGMSRNLLGTTVN